ncbi:hypothetical protein [Brevibacillus brevis]|nr:hypothetical protein [Brevibacillus brevis]WJQ81559.1 hypothetical protein QN310_29695 [Brevibacillus brevis]
MKQRYLIETGLQDGQNGWDSHPEEIEQSSFVQCSRKLDQADQGVSN